jgi:hypothetical protein
MEKVNIGIINLIISESLKKSYFDNTLINESKKITNEFIDTIKNSPILQLEFNVFDNIENKYIENELSATRYIDNNIKLFEIYTVDEINNERNKLKKFTKNNNKNITEKHKKKIELYNAIDNLIIESITDYNNINVDLIHESFTLILNHIKEPKNKLIENAEIKSINPDIIKIAINKFNEKYTPLDEEDKILLQKLIKSNLSEKQNILKEFQDETLVLLESTNNTDNDVNESVQKAINKVKNIINESLTTIDDKIISLYELKRGLIN